MRRPGDLEVPFEAWGLSGQVKARVHSNDDPVQAGHDVVAVGYDRETFSGFPVASASITYSGDGYRAFFGWFQTVTHVYADPAAGESTTIDSWPNLGAPLVGVGYKPQFFDAPANPDHSDMRWLAHTFLVRVGLRDRSLEALAGFSWGYDLADGRPAILGLATLTMQDWTRVTDDTRADLVDWTLTCDSLPN